LPAWRLSSVLIMRDIKSAYSILRTRCGRLNCAINDISALLLALPPLRVRIPDTFAEQPIQIWKVRIAVDEEVKAFAIFFARPLAGPQSPARIIGMEVRTTECLPAAVRTTFNVAAAVVALADSRAAIRTGSAFHDLSSSGG
jgi:hypothetical protein